jgi:hypothetical protein
MHLQINELQLKEESVKRCILESNQGEVLNYEPSSNTIIKYQDKIIERYDNKCSIRMYSINNTHAGVWKITVYIVQNQNKTGERKSPASYNDGVISREEVFVFHLHTVQVNLALYRRFFFLPFLFSFSSFLFFVIYLTLFPTACAVRRHTTNLVVWPAAASDRLREYQSRARPRCIEDHRIFFGNKRDRGFCDNRRYEEYIRLVFQRRRAIPTENIEAYEGMYVSMKHNENYENLTACSLMKLKVR